MSLDGDTAVIGAAGADAEQGAAYVFVRSGGSWTQQAKLTAADGAPTDRFGERVAVDGDTALVGTFYPLPFRARHVAIPPTSSFEAVAAGSSRRGSSPPTGPSATVSVSSLAIAGDTALFGAPSDTVGTTPPRAPPTSSSAPEAPGANRLI